MTTSPRNLGLDALRGLAVVLMVQQHLGVWLIQPSTLAGPLGGLLLRLNLLGGAAAPLFVVLTGVGLALAHPRMSPGAAHEPALDVAAPARPRTDTAWLGRALGLFVVAYALNALTPNWFSLGSFYVLHLIATFWLFAPVLRRLPTSALVGLAACLLGLTFWAQKICQTPRLLTNSRMSDTSLPGGMLRLALLEGHFPLLPWLGFALAGLVTGRLYCAKKPERLRLVIGGAAVLGVSLVGLGLGFPRLVHSLGLRSATTFSFYPASTAFVLLMIAACAPLVWGALRLGERGGLTPRNPLVGLGRLSLTILVVHVVVFRQFTAELGYNGHWPPVVVLTVILGVLAGFVWLERAWAGVDYRFSLEWALHRAALTLARPDRHKDRTPGPGGSFH